MRKAEPVKKGLGFFKAKVASNHKSFSDWRSYCCRLLDERRIRTLLKTLKHWTNDTPTDSLIQIRGFYLLLLSIAYYAPIAISFVYGLWAYAWLILIAPIPLRAVMIWGPITVLGLVAGVVNPKRRC